MSAPDVPALRVMRQDDNGDRFVVVEGLPRAEAEVRVAGLTARGHEQTYWTEPGRPAQI